MLLVSFIFGVFLSVCDSDILTNEVESEYGITAVVVHHRTQKMVLLCNYTGDLFKNDDKIEYEWRKDNVSLKPSTKYSMKVEGFTGTLTVDGSSVEDAGNYTCILNGAETGTLRVVMYPHIEPTEKSKNQVQGDPLTLTCKVKGYPTPSVSWEKDGDDRKMDDPRFEFQPIDGVPNAKLIIKDLQYTDKGKYKCTAVTNNVKRHYEFTVRVKDKYAALWPFLGICAEVAILCTIIFIFERRRTKPEFEEDDDKKDSPSHNK